MSAPSARRTSRQRSAQLALAQSGEGGEERGVLLVCDAALVFGDGGPAEVAVSAFGGGTGKRGDLPDLIEVQRAGV